jgi:hypothetical protein
VFGSGSVSVGCVVMMNVAHMAAARLVWLPALVNAVLLPLVDKPADKPGYPHKATKGGIELHTFKSLTQRAKHSATETRFALAEGAHQSADASEGGGAQQVPRWHWVGGAQSCYGSGALHMKSGLTCGC